MSIALRGELSDSRQKIAELYVHIDDAIDRFLILRIEVKGRSVGRHGVSALAELLPYCSEAKL